MVNYKPTYQACALASISQAAVVNLTPLMFIPLQAQYGFSFTMLGALVFINFATQLIVDLICSPILDRLGFRFFAVTGHMCAALGLVMFAAWQWLPFPPFPGFVAATVVFSVGGGMLEVVTSPIINSLPAREKSAVMSLMHGFYSWGQVGVVLLTTLCMYFLGVSAWPAAFLGWAVLPFINGLQFTRCPIAPPVPAGERVAPGLVARSPLFVLVMLIIFFAGASELTISQWTSAYAESVLNVPKVAGDVLGMCLFAVAMGVGRTVNGIKGTGANLRGWMLAGGVLSAVCYITAALTQNAVLGLAACALCGLGVSLMWPGALSLGVEAFPLAGSWMMAFMAAAGDLGGSVGPQLAGFIADRADLRISLLVSAVFPIGIILCVILEGFLKKRRI
jgi:fucose permease